MPTSQPHPRTAVTTTARVFAGALATAGPAPPPARRASGEPVTTAARGRAG
ncbi:hypothetical protein [Streptomyces mutabilis]|uniref:hypothetical protein n=1 Tax=Streptomyces mutabilis TaxID=67332 RepID=UPI000A46788A|nr:hypothetical protein [Streptomyces mutabilis]